MRYNEIIESQDDDDDLFGRGLHHRIANALLAQSEEDQRVSDEERGLGDLENAAEFAKQASNYRYIADAFNQSMAMGVKVYRSLDRSWKGAVDDVIDIEFDMDFRDYVKQIPESADDDDLFSTSPKLDRRHELRGKTIRRTAQRDALNIQPGTRLMVKWDNGKYYKGKVVRLTPSGRLVVQVKFKNVDWPLEKNISPHQVKPEHIINEAVEDHDDELFGAQPAGAKGMIYQVGKQILNQLEQSWSVPDIRTEYKQYQEAGDTDAQFDQVVRITKKPFRQAFVVDIIIREFAGMEGLNDFGWMLDNGQFHELTDAWERFKNDDDIESEDWFQNAVRDFTGGLK